MGCLLLIRGSDENILYRGRLRQWTVSWTVCECHGCSICQRNSAGTWKKLRIFFAIESNHKFLKVSDTAFSLTAAYYLGYYWQDKRLSIKKGDWKYIPQGAEKVGSVEIGWINWMLMVQNPGAVRDKSICKGARFLTVISNICHSLFFTNSTSFMHPLGFAEHD